MKINLKNKVKMWRQCAKKIQQERVIKPKKTAKSTNEAGDTAQNDVTDIKDKDKKDGEPKVDAEPKPVNEDGDEQMLTKDENSAESKRDNKDKSDDAKEKERSVNKQWKRW